MPHGPLFRPLGMVDNTSEGPSRFAVEKAADVIEFADLVFI